MIKILKAVKHYICTKDIVLFMVINKLSITILYIVDIWSINKSLIFLLYEIPKNKIFDLATFFQTHIQSIGFDLEYSDLPPFPLPRSLLYSHSLIPKFQIEVTPFTPELL